MKEHSLDKSNNTILRRDFLKLSAVTVAGKLLSGGGEFSTNLVEAAGNDENWSKTAENTLRQEFGDTTVSILNLGRKVVIQKYSFNNDGSAGFVYIQVQNFLNVLKRTTGFLT